jgi:hypothetical protein
MTFKHVVMILMLWRCVSAHGAPAPRKLSMADLFGVQEINLNLNGKKLSLTPMLNGLATGPLSRHINAAFAFDPLHPPPWMLAEENAEITAFKPPVPIVLDKSRRDSLQGDVDMILQAVLEQERRHNFHGYISPTAAKEAFSVEIIDSDDASIVRANCNARKARISTGFIRRLLERSIATALTERMLGLDDKPDMWPTSEDGNWPPSLTYTIETWRGMADMEGITLTRTVKRMLALQERLGTDVVPGIDKRLKELGYPEDNDTFAEMNAGSDSPVGELANRIGSIVQLSGAPRRALDEINAAYMQLVAAAEKDENSQIGREMAQFEAETEQFVDGSVMDPTMESWILTRFSQEQYLKALCFIIAHEASHLWMDGCAASNENENRADAYAVLVSFELFHNHQSRVKMEANGFMTLPELPKDENPMTAWFAEALGWSGFDLVAETFGKAGIAPDSSHDNFETRSDLVRDLYLNLVKTVVRPIGE